jgi:hypothetical protein
MMIYQDLLIDIVIYQMQLNTLENEYEFWRERLSVSKPPFAGMDECAERMDKLAVPIEETRRILHDKQMARAQIENTIKQLKGLEQKVEYMTAMGMTLREISIQLGYSYDWIRKINSRRHKKRHTKGTKKAQSV